MRLSLLFLICIAQFSINPAAPAQSETGKPELPEILALWTPYQETLKAVAADRDKKLENLDRIYLLNLDKMQKDTTAAGDLDGALAVKAERDRTAAHQETTDEQRKAMGPALAKLRASYDAALKGYMDEAMKREAALRQRYLADLDALQKRITTTGNLQKALLVKAERERVTLGAAQGLAPLGIGSLRAPAVSAGTYQIFDGKTLNGWTVRGDASRFTVQDGMLCGNGKGANIFYTGTTGKPPAWKDFDLSFKVKTDDKANSGVWVHAGRDPKGNAVYAGALEVQIDNAKDPQKTGSIWSVKPVSEKLASDGEWFDMRVVVKGMTITVYVNGRLINEWTQPANWQPPAKLPNARLGEGLIGFQANGGQVWFKDIQVRPLP